MCQQMVLRSYDARCQRHGPGHHLGRLLSTQLSRSLATVRLPKAEVAAARLMQVSKAFRDMKLYGREIEIEFTLMSLVRIVHKIVAMAEFRRPALDLPGHGHTRAAIDGLAQAPRDLTALEVEVAGTSVRLVWARPRLAPPAGLATSALTNGAAGSRTRRHSRNEISHPVLLRRPQSPDLRNLPKRTDDDTPASGESLPATH